MNKFQQQVLNYILSINSFSISQSVHGSWQLLLWNCSEIPSSRTDTILHPCLCLKIVSQTVMNWFQWRCHRHIISLGTEKNRLLLIFGRLMPVLSLCSGADELTRGGSTAYIHTRLINESSAAFTHASGPRYRLWVFNILKLSRPLEERQKESLWTIRVSCRSAGGATVRWCWLFGRGAR